MLATIDAQAPAKRSLTVAVPAKVNLSLHVVGQREDGYHLLDSVVVFTEAAYDEVTVTFGDGPAKLTASGPFADALPPCEDNAVKRAADAVGGIAGVHLAKGLPIASGLGGGSADAAGVLRASVMAGRLSETQAFKLAQDLGADVPVCLLGRACRMAGIGESLSPLSAGAVPAVLVNPGVQVETRSVFRRLTEKSNTPMAEPLDVATADAVIQTAIATRNDLMEPAVSEQPIIGDVIAAVAGSAGCRFARMSGSGASVFGLFEDDHAAAAAAATIEAASGWWTSATRFSSAQ